MIARDDVEQALERVCGSEGFTRSRRLCRFLRYVVDETLAGRGRGLKGYSVGLAVFDRGSDFNPESDSIVRVEAQRLRQALTLYYHEAGRNDPLRIDLPKGGYVPVFKVQNQREPEKADTDECCASIIVLPMENLSGDPAQDYFALGLMRELVSILGSYRDLEVVSSSRGAAHLDRKGEKDTECARFLLGGSTRVGEHHIRVTVELVDAASGKQAWANRYTRERTAEDLFSIQERIADDIALQVADRYGGAINRTLIGDAHQRTKERLGTYEAVLSLHDYNKFSSVDAYYDTLAALEAAVKVHPEHTMAWAALSELRIDGYTVWGVNDDKESVIAEARRYAGRAIGLDPSNEYAYFALGLVDTMDRKPRKLIKTAEQMLGLNRPPSSMALAAWFLALAGEWDKGLGILKDLPDVLRTGPGWLHHVFFLDHYRHGRYQDALDAAESFAIPGLFWDPVDRAAALGMLGRVKEGQSALEEIQKLRPDFTRNPRRYLECYIMQDELLDEVIEGLKKAGMDFDRPRLSVVHGS